MAFDLHREQTRKGSGAPYVAHVLGVSSLVLEYGGDEDCAIAALLHDAVEDQGGAAALEQIGVFGSRVTAIVVACSDSMGEPKPPWRDRKEAYIRHLPSASADAQLVSACDKLHNARAILSDYRVLGEALWSRFTGGREGVLWYYQAVASALTISNEAVAELRRTVSALVSLATLTRAHPSGAD